MKHIALFAALALVAAPMAAADHGGDHGDPPDAANFGLCTAQDASEEGDENSNGTVSDTPPFSSLDEEDCENAEPPAGPGDTPAPDDPGSDAPSDPGSQAPDNPGGEYIPSDPGSQAPDNPGDEHQPDDPGGDNQPDAASLGFLP